MAASLFYFGNLYNKHKSKMAADEFYFGHLYN